MLALERQPLGALLVDRGIIASADLDRALDSQRKGGRQKLLGEILVEQKFCSGEQVAEALAAAQGVPFARVGPRLADPKVVALFPIDLLRRKCILPLFLVEGTLTVALAEPANLFLIEEIERRSGGHHVQVVAATARDIRATLDVYLPSERAFIIERPEDPELDTAVRLLDAPKPDHGASDKSPEPAIVRLLESCIQRAIAQCATEIHLEPGPSSLRIRMRVDGRLIEHLHPPHRLHEPLVSLAKSMTGMDCAKRSVPQEGRARIAIGDRRLVLEAMSLPLSAGEKMVLRLVPEEDHGPLKLEKLGFSYEMLKQWRRVLSMPAGLVLVAGPAGSGKRAILHSALHERNTADANLCSIESRIERVIPGVNQIRIDEQAGFGFAAALRAALRQEPDVLMIEQLPDADTARLAAQAALSGKLVLAGMHAGDAPTAVWHLTHQGLDPHLLASTLAGVLARRLVRKLCPSCREPREATAAERRQFDRLPANGTLTLFAPRGCERCNNLGYAGRIGIHELLVPDETLRERISRGITLPDLRDLARQPGLKPLRLDGLEKVRAGVTTLDEVLRAAA